jgi:hypothetical protein
VQKKLPLPEADTFQEEALDRRADRDRKCSHLTWTVSPCGLLFLCDFVVKVCVIETIKSKEEEIEL